MHDTIFYCRQREHANAPPSQNLMIAWLDSSRTESINLSTRVQERKEKLPQLRHTMGAAAPRGVHKWLIFHLFPATSQACAEILNHGDEIRGFAHLLLNISKLTISFQLPEMLMFLLSR